jgi:hypothetical protein
MTTLLRPSYLRPLALSRHIGTSARPALPAYRCFSVSARRLAGPVQGSASGTTALKDAIREKEESSPVKVVGDHGKGVEGPHYQGKWMQLEQL